MAAETDKTVMAVLKWCGASPPHAEEDQGAGVQLWRDTGESRATQARLRRAAGVFDALLLAETHALIRLVRDTGDKRLPRDADERLAAGEPGIITCSNLKRAYRRITVGERKGVTLVFLRAAEPVIAARLAQREHRYMPASLLQSQLRILEEPAADERAVVVGVDGSLKETVIDLLRRLAAAQAARA